MGMNGLWRSEGESARERRDKRENERADRLIGRHICSDEGKRGGGTGGKEGSDRIMSGRE